MTDSVKITIATPVFNGAATLRETLESVVNQSYKNIEYVLVDGNSKDDSLTIIKKYAEHYPSIIKYISEPDAGIYDAMNKAQEIATGDFLLFLGSDDILYNNTVIENFVKLVTNINSVYYGDVFAGIVKEVWFGAFTAEKLIMQNISHQAIFYPKDVYKKFTYNLRYKLWADWEYNLRVWSQYNQFKRVELIITLYAETGASNNNEDRLFIYDRNKIVKQYFGKKYSWLLKMQRMKVTLIGKTDLRKVKGFLFHRLK